MKKIKSKIHLKISLANLHTLIGNNIKPVRNIEAIKGLNSEIFNREQLGASGILYYTLESGDFTATKKMIIVE